MKQEIKDLLKQINGKEVVWIDPTGFYKGIRVKCIILAHPDKPKVSIKPYGYTPIGLFRKLKQYCPTLKGTVEDVARETFCLSTVGLRDPFLGLDITDSIKVKMALEYLVEVPDKGELDWDALNRAVNDGEKRETGRSPSCPY
jgi:hypothetical protein